MPRHFNNLCLAFVFALIGCGGCSDDVAQVAFFEPASFGEYAPEPDIHADRVIDFGAVAAGEVATRPLWVSNVGAADLVITDLSVSDAAFEIRGSVQEIRPREQEILDVVFVAVGAAARREVIRIASNDPDESVVEVALVANLTTPCVGSFRAGQSVWQVHDGGPPSCWGDFVSPGHGHPSEYDRASIPLASDAGWRDEPDDHISFDRASQMCDLGCWCLDGGDFTYFQTSLFVPRDGRVGRYEIQMDRVDDGARVTVFNSRYPNGVTDPESYARYPGGSSADLAPYLVEGDNRMVITHVDDCCRESRIADVFTTIDDEEVERCAL